MEMRRFLPAILIAVTLLPLAGESEAFGQGYGLRNLRPIGLTQQAAGPDHHQLLHFQNDLGDQYILYEESATAGGIREIAGLVPFLGNSGHICSIDLECKNKAFCTDGCKKLYYEVFNTAAPAGRNSCVIKAFTCSMSGP